MKKIAIFASGSGSNAEKIALYFANNKDIKISLILTNNKDAFVLERAKKLNVPSFVFNRKDLVGSDRVLHLLKEHDIDFVVLAGFLWLVPLNIIQEYKGKIINIHPALLPKYGGKGMYGMNVHEAVIKNKETISGITIHYVNEEYDKGDIIIQARCKVEDSDTPETLAEKIHELEHEYFPKTIEKIIKEKC